MASSRTLENLNALVIGAGFGGLASAIELARRGAKVRVFESARDMKRQGDVIQLGPNATRLLEHWGDILEDIKKTSVSPTVLTIMKKDGKVLLDQDLPTEYDGYPMSYGNRGRIQLKLYEYAKSLGVEVTLGAAVTEVFETAETAGCCVGDERIEADILIGADGVHSNSRYHVTGISDRPKKSGFAVYRSWFPLERLAEDPVTEYIAKSDTPLYKIWIEQDTHAILTTNPALKSATCFVTHKASGGNPRQIAGTCLWDDSDIKEDWNLKGDLNDMLACVQGWDDQLSHIIQHIPPEVLRDFKLLWRDPVSKWVSDGGRVCLVGDAAHPHLPTAGTGAAQAIEDAVTIAVALEKAGRAEAPLALKVYHRLRYERTSLTQRMGWETRHVWHQTDWEAVAVDPSILRLPQPAWLLGVDARQYAEDNFDAAVANLQKGVPFVSTNVPAGNVYEEWTIETMLSQEGKVVDKDFYKTRDNNQEAKMSGH